MCVHTSPTFHSSKIITDWLNGLSHLCLPFGWFWRYSAGSARAEEAETAKCVKYAIPRKGPCFYFFDVCDDGAAVDARMSTKRHMPFLDYILPRTLIAEVATIRYANATRHRTIVDESVLNDQALSKQDLDKLSRWRVARNIERVRTRAGRIKSGPRPTCGTTHIQNGRRQCAAKQQKQTRPTRGLEVCHRDDMKGFLQKTLLHWPTAAGLRCRDAQAAAS